MTVESAREAKFWIKGSRAGGSDEEVFFGNIDQGETTKFYHQIFEAETGLPGGIYPHNTTVTYEIEDEDLYHNFDHETGVFTAHRAAKFDFSFFCAIICHDIEQKLYFLKNGYPLLRYSCTFLDEGEIFEGSAGTRLNLKEGDRVEVWSGFAEIVLDTKAARFSGSFDDV